MARKEDIRKRALPRKRIVTTPSICSLINLLPACAGAPILGDYSFKIQLIAMQEKLTWHCSLTVQSEHHIQKS